MDSEAQKLLEQYKAVIDRSTIVSKTDPRGVITYANAKFCEISGYTPEELIGRPHNIVRHPDMPAEAFRQMWETIKAGQPWHGVVKNRTKEGRTYVVDAVITPIFDASGNIAEYIGVRTDITEIEQLRERLAQDLERTTEGYNHSLNRSSEYERAIRESTILSRTDIDGNIIYINDRFTEVTGFAPNEVLGRTHNLLRHPGNSDALYLDIWHTLHAGRTWRGTIKNRAKDGRTIWLDSILVPIKNTGGEIEEFFGIRHDITPVMKLHEELENTQREVIYRMGEIGEMRNKETGNHVRRVAEYSRLLARKAGLDAQACETLYAAAPMHDIGKVAIPDSVLLKPDRLTPEEFEIIKTHAEAGYAVLRCSERPILQAAAIVAYQHHERWDGGGYPQGLRGEAIHIFGRITAIADVFDALGSERPYKEAWNTERIIELFRSERGKQFDPRLSDLFLENFEEFAAIRKQLED
ncbi:MAG: PAS domain S-box protein [Campylobacterales bacterium]